MKKFLIALPLLVAVLAGCSTAEKVELTPTATPTAKVSSTPSPVASKTPAAPTPSTSPSPTAEPSKAAENSVEAVLSTLVVNDQEPQEKYDRALFNHWVKKNDTGCDTRFAVLESESIVPVTKSGKCKITAGKWLSVYDGKTITNPKEMDIDHMVPLKEAWLSGAYAWTPAQREAYANDLTYSEALVAVTAASNRAKSAGDPNVWMPIQDEACSYIANWVGVKAKYKLTVDTAEKAKIGSILKGCNGESTVTTVPQEPTTENVTPPVPPEDSGVVVEEPTTKVGVDTQYPSCKAAKAAGFGPYKKGQPEYEWYTDGDGDGIACE